ncbi:hypothetical protein T492DRAFT_848715 [Pavlovales sp. CCMP2436]|nr:hypothetical protein T492DRAFT_848715 [Pavlovales sp. CCMP2436]
MPAALVLALACAATLPEALLPDLASERAASSRARATCAAIPFSEPTAQLTPGVNELGLRCEPPGGGPPCVLEPFFSRVGNSSEHARNLAQCVARKRDEDWPIYEPYARRTTATKTVVDVQGLLGGRSVTIIGASVAAQLRAAVHCALASAGLERDTSRWQHWGWAMFARDNRGLAGFTDRLNCTRDGGRLQKALSASSVIIAAYNPGHYGMNSFSGENEARLWARD